MSMSMSITAYSDVDKVYKKSFHLRNDSGELDVFDAARYFAGADEVLGFNATTCGQKAMREDQNRQVWRSGRLISLEMPARSVIPSSQAEKQEVKEKKYKQPSSPGGRLASFLNALFNQTSSKKQKSKSSLQSVKDEDESSGGRRKRRSSVSHFRSSSAADASSKSMYSSSSSGFRTTPPYAATPTKSYEDLRSLSDHNQAVTLPKQNGLRHFNPTNFLNQNEVYDEKRDLDYAWLDEKYKFSNGVFDKYKNFGDGYVQKDQYESEEKVYKKFNEVDEGADSDSSSDLFELQNCDLNYYSSGLPVYETTHLDNIKRGAPISNGLV